MTFEKQYYIGFCGCSQHKGKFVYLLLLLLPRAYRLNIRQKLEFEKSHELSPPLLVTDREDRGIFSGRTDTRAVVEKLSLLPYTTLGSCCKICQSYHILLWAVVAKFVNLTIYYFGQLLKKFQSYGILPWAVVEKLSILPYTTLGSCCKIVNLTIYYLGQLLQNCQSYHILPWAVSFQTNF
jgi:hypothetical protein